MDYQRFFLMLCWLTTISLAQTNVPENMSGNWSEDMSLRSRLINAPNLSQGQRQQYPQVLRDSNSNRSPQQIEPDSKYGIELDEKLPESLFCDEAGKIPSRVLYTTETRDDSLFLLYYVRQEWSGTEWINNHRRTITYDIEGNPVWQLEEQWDENGWVNDIKYYYT